LCWQLHGLAPVVTVSFWQLRDLLVVLGLLVWHHLALVVHGSDAGVDEALDHVGGVLMLPGHLGRLVELLLQLSDLLGVSVSALLSEALLLLEFEHLLLVASALGAELEQVGAAPFGLCRSKTTVTKQSR
jgi:hypothetical protein